MAQPIRAVYNEGWLRLLDPVNLVEGEQIQVTILSERDQVMVALGDMVVQPSDFEDDIDEAELARVIEEGFRGQPPLSETIIQERREGP